MPISFTIREEGHVFYLVFVDPWTKEDLLKLYEQEQHHIEQSPFQVHSLVNLFQAQHFVQGTLRISRHRGGMDDPRRGRVAVVGASNFLRNLTELIFRTARSNRLRFFVTEDDAWAYLRQIIREEGTNS